MARSLNEKYFGNRNTGSASTTADDGIGGTAVASVTLGTLGSYTVRPTITFSPPDLAAEGGVTATGTVTSEVLSATISGGSGYGNAQTFDLTVNTAGGTAVLNVTSTAGGAITTVNSITSRGTFTTLGAVTSISGGTGSGATPVLTYRAKEIVITEPGSGYSHAVDATASFSGSATLPGTPTVNMIVDTGTIRTVGNQENAIKMTAYLTGGSAVLVDIKRQVSSRRYKVTDGTRTGNVKLVAAASGSLVAGEANIIATDATGCTYYVTKLAGRRATLTRFGGGSYEFADGASVSWTMNGTSGTKAYSAQPYLATGVNVQIANT
jgi:hypothetical protein